MDLLFKRYASPYLFVDGMIQTGRFCEFVTDFIGTTNKEKEDESNWEFFLHKVWDCTFNDFKDEIKINKENQGMSERKIETTVKHSMDILKNFSPG